MLSNGSFPAIKVLFLYYFDYLLYAALLTLVAGCAVFFCDDHGAIVGLSLWSLSLCWDVLWILLSVLLVVLVAICGFGVGLALTLTPGDKVKYIPQRYDFPTTAAQKLIDEINVGLPVLNGIHPFRQQTISATRLISYIGHRSDQIVQINIGRRQIRTHPYRPHFLFTWKK